MNFGGVPAQSAEFQDFVSCFFHRLNNLIGGISGRLELILTFRKETYIKKLPDVDIQNFLEVLEGLRDMGKSENPVDLLSALLLDSTGAGVPGITSFRRMALRDFFTDSKNRFVSAIRQKRQDKDFQFQVKEFLGNMAGVLPGKPVLGFPNPDFQLLFNFTTDLTLATRKQETQWLGS